MPVVAIVITACAFALYWLFRPERFRPITPNNPQFIPGSVPPGMSVFLHVPNDGLERLELFYRTAGDPSKPAVLLIHGIAGSSDTTWYNTFEALSKDYYVVAPDLRAHGLTMKPHGATSITQMADDLYALMQTLQVESAHVVGHSLGGTVAMQMAHDHPDRVKSLVLIGTSAGWTRESLFAFGFQIYPFVVRLRNRTAGWEQENRVRAAAFTRYEVAPQYQEWVFQKRMFNQTEAFLESWKAIGNFDAVDWLPTLKQPTLIIYGENDDLVMPKMRKQLADLRPGSQLAIIRGARHYPQIQSADKVNPLLLKFLSDVG